MLQKLDIPTLRHQKAMKIVCTVRVCKLIKSTLPRFKTTQPNLDEAHMLYKRKQYFETPESYFHDK